MFEAVIEQGSLDLFSLSSDLQDFLRRFETTEKQKRLIPTIIDELMYPLFNAPDKPALRINLKLICSESSNKHTIHLNVEGVGSDPLDEPYVDELNLSILENYAEFIFSREAKKSWEIAIQM